MPAIAPISQQIWDMKYRLKAADGTPVDGAVEDTWVRVARALASAEAAPAAWEPRFVEAMTDFRFLPAGRIVAGAGAGRRVTLFNCFVMGAIPDAMTGIFEHLKEAALTMQQGGGIGYDFSTLRPKGAPVKGVGADASGPLSFMDVWDAMCRTIMSAGHRRGAMMATLRCDHPEIEAFIAAKADPGRLRMFNLSVLVSDSFMAAVKDDAPWELSFGGVCHEVVSARGLWESIMRATHAYAEPGVIFIDRVNRRNNLHYAETIAATNPCVTADTWVHTSAGPCRVRDLVGRRFSAMLNGTAHKTDRGFFATGHKSVVRIRTRQGHNLRLTADHLVRAVASKTRSTIERTWVPAAELGPGDLIALNDHRARASWPGRHTEAEGYLIGLLLGDGTLKRDAAVLSAWPGKLAVNGGYERPGVGGVMARAEAAARTLPHRRDFAGWSEVAGRGEFRLKSASLRELAARLGLGPGGETVTAAIEETSSEFYRGFLGGFFDAEGGVIVNHQKGVSVRLAQSDLPALEAVQRMLLRLGIASRIYRDRRRAGHSMPPDGAGGAKLYATAAQHELVVSNENIARFAERIGFTDSAKQTRLTTLMSQYRRRLNRERFVAQVESVVPDGSEEVYDLEVPGANAFDANGLIVHNCGEQPLPPYGACLLGSINLARLVARPFAAGAALDGEALERLVPVAVRMLDDAIDISEFPLPQQAAEARAKRRIGLGITGLADALILCGLRYDSEAGAAAAGAWMKAVQRAAYLASAELAKEKGAFPLYEREPYLAGETVAGLDADVREAIARHGVRNALVTSVAPTGTISIFADNVSSGLEPVFSFTYRRNVLMPDGARREQEVSDYAYRLYRRIEGEDAPLTEAFVDAQNLVPADHVRMQAAIQAHVDSAVSKTVNCPEDIDFEDFQNIYRAAYDAGLKGITTYRPNDVTGAVLEVKGGRGSARQHQAELPLESPPAPARDVYEAGGVVYMTQPLDRPEVLPGSTYKVRWPESDHAMYITINDIVTDGRRRPFEVFVNSKNMEHYAWTVALTRMISAVFRRGCDVSFVVDELKAVFDPRGGAWVGGRYVPSILAAIGEVIEEHLIRIGFIADPSSREDEAERLRLASGMEEGATAARLHTCPRCGQPGLIRLENCDTCTACGYSKCS